MKTDVPMSLPVNPDDMRAPLTEIRRHLEEMWFAFRDSHEPSEVQEYDLETNRIMFTSAVFEALQSLHLVESQVEHIRVHRQDSEVKAFGRPLTNQERTALRPVRSRVRRYRDDVQHTNRRFRHVAPEDPVGSGRPVLRVGLKQLVTMGALYALEFMRAQARVPQVALHFAQC